jgi:hypothetical protein
VGRAETLGLETECILQPAGSLQKISVWLLIPKRECASSTSGTTTSTWIWSVDGVGMPSRTSSRSNSPCSSLPLCFRASMRAIFSPFLSFLTSSQLQSNHVSLLVLTRNSCRLPAAKSYFRFTAIVSFKSHTHSVASISTANVLPFSVTRARISVTIFPIAFQECDRIFV